MKKLVCLFCMIFSIQSFSFVQSGQMIDTSNLSIDREEILDISNSNETYNNFENNINVDGEGIMDIKEAINAHEVNGVSIAIIEDGKVSQHRYYGFQDKNKTRPTSENTIYQAASMTKFIASLSIIEAERLGYLSLDESMTYYGDIYPDSILSKWINKKFKNNEKDYPESINMRMLLSMTAGLDTWSIGTQLPGFEKKMKGIILGNVLDPFNNGVNPISAPGTSYSYSGGGYTVAEHLLELATGMSSKEWFTQYFLDELSMNKSTFEEASKLSDADDENLARGCSRGICLYDVMNTKVKAAGGLLATVDDYAKVLVAVMNNGKDENGLRVIKKSNIQEALSPIWHKQSSLNSCSADTDCPSTRKTCLIGGICIDQSVEEKCIQNQCKEIIMDGNDYYGRGVSLGKSLDEDGLPKSFFHGGNQDGFSTYFYGHRASGKGIVIMINGNREWTKSDYTYGADKLKSQILSAYFDTYF